MRALELVEPMGITIGRPEIVIGSIDGTVALDHPDLAGKPPSRVECAVKGIDGRLCHEQRG